MKTSFRLFQSTTIRNEKNPRTNPGAKETEMFRAERETRWEGGRKGRAARNIPTKSRMYGFVGVPVSIPDCFISYYEKSS